MIFNTTSTDTNLNNTSPFPTDTKPTYSFLTKTISTFICKKKYKGRNPIYTNTSSFPFNIQNMYLQTTDNNIIGTYFISPTTNSNKNWIIVLHGRSTNRYSFVKNYTSFIQSLLNCNYNIAIPDVRNFGDSNGTYSNVGVVYDVSRVVDYICSLSLCGVQSNVCIIGHGLGASIALAYASNCKNVESWSVKNYEDFVRYTKMNFESNDDKLNVEKDVELNDKIDKSDESDKIDVFKIDKIQNGQKIQNCKNSENIKGGSVDDCVNEEKFYSIDEMVNDKAVSEDKFEVAYASEPNSQNSEDFKNSENLKSSTTSHNSNNSNTTEDFNLKIENQVNANNKVSNRAKHRHINKQKLQTDNPTIQMEDDIELQDISMNNEDPIKVTNSQPTSINDNIPHPQTTFQHKYILISPYITEKDILMRNFFFKTLSKCTNIDLHLTSISYNNIENIMSVPRDNIIIFHGTKDSEYLFEDGLKLADERGCKIYRSEVDDSKSIMNNREIVRVIDEFVKMNVR